MKDRCTLTRIGLLLPLFLLSIVSTSANGEDAIRHSLFIAGPSFTGILNEDGTEGWKADRPAARDGFVLEDGRILIAWANEVVEYATRDNNKILFRYALSKNNREIGTTQRLANGNTLIVELGPEPKLMEINPEGSVAVSFPLQPETDNAHMQTRMARKLPNNNYLVPHLLAFAVKEYASDGKLVSTRKTDLDELGGRPAENWPFTAVRLDQGNTIVSLTHGNKVVEFDAKGQVVWKVSNDDFPTVKPFDDPCGMQRLPNGNIVIASYHAEKGIKVFEVSRDKQIVWRYEGPHRAHGIQVLTTNGEPIPGLPQK
jgi:hypothetical protein